VKGGERGLSGAAGGEECLVFEHDCYLGEIDVIRS